MHHLSIGCATKFDRQNWHGATSPSAMVHGRPHHDSMRSTWNNCQAMLIYRHRMSHHCSPRRCYSSEIRPMPMMQSNWSHQSEMHSLPMGWATHFDVWCPRSIVWHNCKTNQMIFNFCSRCIRERERREQKIVAAAYVILSSFGPVIWTRRSFAPGLTVKWLRQTRICIN